MKAPMPRAGDNSVPSSSVIFCVALWVLKQYCGRPRRQAPTVATDRAPVEDHVVAGRHISDIGSDRVHDSGRFVAE